MPFSLYLHFPFCRNKCSYCDFYKEIHNLKLERQFFHALSIETELAAEEYSSAGTEIDTIYLGGGTPSIVCQRLLSDWLDQVRSLFHVDHDVEFSFECNPESTDLALLTFLRELGVTRPAFGIQSFDESTLRVLNRHHNPSDSHRAAYLAHALGFKSFGVDLLFGLPGQGSKALSKDLDELIDLDPPHVSFYSLTVEEGTPLFDAEKKGDMPPLPDEDQLHALYRGGIEFFQERGYDWYEVCSFAKPGHQCRHNLGYWLGKDYLGLGPAAHSFMNGERFANCRSLHDYNAALNAGRRPSSFDESGLEQRMIETIMLGLRTRQGIDRAVFLSRFGRPVEEKLNREHFDLLVESGHLIPDRGSLRLSEVGLLVADEITRRLVE